MNWILRFQNKATLTALILAAVAFVYQVLGIAGVVPAISEQAVVNVAGLLINVLVACGVVIDPTTEGICDSERAMCYSAPSTMPDYTEILDTHGDGGEGEQ